MDRANEIIIYQTEDGQTKIDVTFENETVWLSQAQMAELFQRDRTVISRHIQNIFEEQELDEKSNVQNLHFANSDKPIKFYNNKAMEKAEQEYEKYKIKLKDELSPIEKEYLKTLTDTHKKLLGGKVNAT